MYSVCSVLKINSRHITNIQCIGLLRFLGYLVSPINCIYFLQDRKSLVFVNLGVSAQPCEVSLIQLPGSRFSDSLVLRTSYHSQSVCFHVLHKIHPQFALQRCCVHLNDHTQRICTPSHATTDTGKNAVIVPTHYNCFFKTSTIFTTLLFSVAVCDELNHGSSHWQQSKKFQPILLLLPIKCS